MGPSFRPVAVAVCGSPAAGKTTIASAVSEALRLPLITRDELAVGLAAGAGASANPDRIREAAEQALIAVSDSLASCGVSFVLESSVLNESHLAPVLQRSGKVLAVHVVTTPAVIGQRLRDRVTAGDTTMRRLVDQHERGVMKPEIFAPSPLADAVVTVDTSLNLPASDHAGAVARAFHQLQT